ncbi:MAG: GEVED domain-containing protein, partial [Verrucomicrobiota bacterium]
MFRLLRLWFLLMTALAACVEVHAQSTALLEWQFGSGATFGMTPTTRHNNIVPGDPLFFAGNQMTTVPRYNTSGNSTQFVEYNNWPTTETSGWASAARTSLNPTLSGPTVWTRFSLGPNSQFTLSALAAQFTYQRPSSTSPSSVRACLSWYDGSAYRRRYSPVVTINAAASTTTWASAVNVTIGGSGSSGDALPVTTAMSGKTYLLELQFFGGSSASNKINIDNVKLLADSAVTGSVGWFTPATLPGAQVSRPYFVRLQAGSGNVASYTYSVTSGSIPAGLSLSSGNILGTPTASAGTYNFTIRASTGSTTADRAFSLTIAATPASPTGSNLAYFTFDSDTTADGVQGPNTMSSTLSEVTWGFDTRNSVLKTSLYAEGTAAASGTPITLDRGSSGEMRGFGGWEVGSNYTSTRNSLLHVTDPASNSANWKFAVTPSTNTGSIPPTSYVTTGDPNVLQFSTTFRATAAGNLRAFKADMLRWMKDDMASDGTLGPRYARLYAYYTNNSGVVQRWTGSTVEINSIYYQAMQTANQPQFRTLWWDLSTLDTAVNATTAKYTNREVSFEIYFYYDHGYDGYQTPVVLLDDVGLTGDFTAPTLSIGNLVWDDLDNDGVKDAGEGGLAGAQVELYSPGADNAIGGSGGNADTKIGSTLTTTATGAYSFTSLDPGNYFVKVTPPATHFLTGGTPAATDNRVDNDNNGLQPGGRGTPLYSPIISLAVDAEPTNDGDADNDTDFSVDFGIFRGLGVGNLIYIDSNDSGHFDGGDAGVGGVTVQLFNSANTLIANTTTTSSSSLAGFEVREVKSSSEVRTYAQATATLGGVNQTNFWIGSASKINYLNPAGTDGRFTTGNSAFPDGVAANYAVRAAGTVTIPTTGTYSFGMTLDGGARLRVNNQDVIVDESALHSSADRFGQITLSAGTYPIEMVYWGVSGGAVELYARSGSFSVWSTNFKLVGDTANGGLTMSYTDAASGGRYLFEGISPGSYHVKIPSSEFLSGKPLYGYKSVMNGTPAHSAIDDNGVASGADNGIDTPTPEASGVRTSTFQLAIGSEPVNSGGETGASATSDDATDADVDLTVDLGFHTEQEGCFYVRLIDTDRDGIPQIQRINGSTESTNLIFGGNIANVDRAQFGYDTHAQRLDMQYIFNQLSGKKVEGFYLVLTDGPTPPGDNSSGIMYVDVYDRLSPKVTVMKYQGPDGGQTSYFTPGQLLESSIANPNFCAINVTESGNTLTVSISANMSSVNNGNLWTSYGIDPASWSGMRIGGNMGLWSHFYDLAGAPTYNREGKLTSWPRNTPDSSWWNYIATYSSESISTESPCGTSMTIGNMIFMDANNDGNFDAGEGVDNVLVYLFTEGKNPLMDTPASAVLSSSGGQYAFTGHSAGRYFVHVPPSEFQAGGPLAGKVSNAGAGGDGVADDQLDENGIDAVFPAVTGISTGTIALSDNSEPVDGGVELGANKTTDNTDDNDGDLTVDLGFRSTASITLSGVVWNDADNNGQFSTGNLLGLGDEDPLSALVVDLYSPGADAAIGGSGINADTFVASTATNSSGVYSFGISAPGKYYVRLTPSAAFPTTCTSVVTADNGVARDNNGSQPGGEFTAIYSPVITLLENTEPGSSGSTNLENTIDFGLRSAQKLSVGNLVYLDNNNNGRYDGTDSGMAGVRMQLFNTSNVLVQETTTQASAQISGWRLLQAKAAVAVQTLATADAVLAGTNRTSLWSGTTDLVNYVTTTTNNGVQDYGHEGNGKLLPNGSMENVVLQAAATVNIVSGDTYTFIMSTSDGGRLRIDGSLLIKDDGVHASRDAYGSLVLAPGPHTIEFTGYENTGGGGFEVWAKRGALQTWDEGFRLVGDTANGGLQVSYAGTTADIGRYRFNNVSPGSYYVRIPATEFLAGGALEGRLSFVQAAPPTDDQKDDNSTTGSGDSGVDSATPSTSGISSHIFALAAGGEPTGTAEGGFYGTDDDAADSNGDMTIDFGFDGTKQFVAGCYHFNMKDLDLNANFSAVEEIAPDQDWDFGYNNGNSGAFFYIKDWDMLFDSDKERLTMDVTFDQRNSKKVDSFWICVSPGDSPNSDNTAIIYVNGTNRSAPKLTVYKHTASLDENSWQTTANCLISTAGTGINATDVLNLGVTESGANVRFRFILSTARLNNASNWSVVTNKAAWDGAKFFGRAGVCFHPMDNGTWTYDSAGRITALDSGWPNQGWVDTDESGAYSIRTEISPVLTVGDLVWNDENNNGTKDVSETGIDGVAFELWFPGVNGTRENGGGDDSKIADAVSFNGGFYQFTDVLPGMYYLRIPAPPAAFPLASGVLTALDNSVNNDSNGSQTGGQGTQIVSPLFTLTKGEEPTGNGSNEDTLDFGLRIIPINDFGDWNGSGALSTSTSSTANSNLRIGASVDVETNVVANAAATTDDTTSTGSSDDEDGVNMPASIQQATSTTLPVTVYNNTGSAAYLHAWIDFDNDGAFNNSLVTSGGERLEAVRSIATGTSETTQNITFTVPATASLGTQRGVRFRLTNSNGTGPTGASGIGEVEDYVVTIACPTITLSPSSVAAAVVGTAYSQTITSTGGYGAIIYSVSSGALPAWATLNGATGVISGTPNNTTSASFAIRATDANGCTGARAYILTPACPAITITPGLLPNATLGMAYSQALSASGATAPYTWTVTSGTLPAGLSLSGDGVLSGTATASNGAGVSVTFRAQDVFGCANVLAMTVRVCPVIAVNPASLVSGMVGVPYSQTISASGGAAAYTYAVASGVLPAGLSLNTSTGVLNGTPTTPETQAFSLRAMDANTCVGTRAYSITIAPNTDFGDFNGFGSASSVLNGNLKLGATAPDTETTGATNAAANGDDTTATDDEDGVTHGTLRAGQSGTVTVNVTNTSGAVAYLNVWADWDRDNNADSGEQIATNVAIANGTNAANQVLTITPPASTATGTLPLRARITSVTGAGLTGAFANGEVEDHLITITAPNLDFGDHSTFPQATSIANGSLKLGSLAADAESAMTANTTANADDTNGTDDEDGVTQSTLRAGQGGTITVNITNSSATAAYLNVWTDWNNNGVADGGEQIATNTNIAAATSNSDRVLNITPPTITVTGTIPLRARLTNSTSPGFSNAFPGTTQGEVEDHLITITAPDRDFGDWDGSGAATTTAFSTQNGNLRLGDNFDAEATVSPNATATADDATGNDEDGAVVPATIMQTMSTTIPVMVLNNTGSNAFLHAWIDFNNDGTFDNNLVTSGGERLESAPTIASGAATTLQNVSFIVPVTASVGNARGVRIRLTNSSATTPTTAGGIGEIEDYVTSIAAATDYGDYDVLAAASSGMVATLRIGAATDAELVNPANNSASGDDASGADDEDGVAVPASITAGSVGASLSVTVTNTSGAPAYLSAWVDFNRNGVLSDSGELVASSLSIANGVTNGVQTITFNVPVAASLGTAAVRVRLSSVNGASSVGAAGNGEVEDYTLSIVAPVTDYGDDNDFADAFST